MSVREAYATLLDEGIDLGSIATIHRLLRCVGETSEWWRIATHPARIKPEQEVNAPQQVWRFSTGADGIEYERHSNAVLDRLEAVNAPTLAAVRGFCIRGGLAITGVCDLRIATRSARFGVPIARTLGNCPSIDTCSLLASQLGPGRLTRPDFARLPDVNRDGARRRFVSEACEGFDLERLPSDIDTEIVS